MAQLWGGKEVIRQSPQSSVQTELEQQWPTYVVCKWIGNTTEIANKHYLTVTEEHFEMAAATDTENRDEIWDAIYV